MQISATISNSLSQNEITVTTNDSKNDIHIPSKSTGKGSSVNGGELLFLSLATCFCNDIYREAGKRNIDIESVEVTVSGEFGKEGEPAISISYKTNIKSNAPKNEISDLIRHVDQIAEIHNTLRRGIDVTLQIDPTGDANENQIR